MIESILIAFIIAMLNKLNIIPTLKLEAMIPIYIATGLYVFMITLKSLKLSNPLKNTVPLLLLLLIVPVIYFVIIYGLYIRFVLGVILFVLGVFLNNVAVSKNDNRMPVFPSLSYITKFTSKDKLSESETHQLGNKNTKWIILTDIFDFGYNVFSIGDFLIFSGFGIVMYGVISRLG